MAVVVLNPETKAIIGDVVKRFNELLYDKYAYELHGRLLDIIMCKQCSRSAKAQNSMNLIECLSGDLAHQEGVSVLLGYDAGVTQKKLDEDWRMLRKSFVLHYENVQGCSLHTDVGRLIDELHRAQQVESRKRLKERFASLEATVIDDTELNVSELAKILVEIITG